MKINNLIGISGHINSGKDLVGEMLTYIDSSDKPSYEEYTTYIGLGSDVKIKKCAEKLKEIVAIIIGCTRKDLEDETFKNTPLGEEWIKYVNGIKVELTPRKILQLLGTQGGRDIIHPNIWVNSLFSDYKPFDKGEAHDLKTMHELYGEKHCQNCKSKFYGYKRQWLCKECINDDSIQIYPKWIITDVRFPENEGEAVRKRGGLLIGIRRLFILRFPQYADIVDDKRPYAIPKKLSAINPELYNSLMHSSETSQGDHSWCDAIILNDGSIEDLFNQVLLVTSVKYKKI